MPNLKVKRQEAIRALAAAVRKRTAERDAALTKYPAVLEDEKTRLASKLEKIAGSIKTAKTADAVQNILSTNDIGYSWRKNIPAKPTNGACQHARLLKQLQMDAREIIPVGEKDLLWNLLVSECEI